MKARKIQAEKYRTTTKSIYFFCHGTAPALLSSFQTNSCTSMMDTPTCTALHALRLSLSCTTHCIFASHPFSTNTHSNINITYAFSCLFTSLLLPLSILHTLFACTCLHTTRLLSLTHTFTSLSHTPSSSSISSLRSDFVCGFIHQDRQTFMAFRCFILGDDVYG